jgi:urease accessory protein
MPATAMRRIRTTTARHRTITAIIIMMTSIIAMMIIIMTSIATMITTTAIPMLMTANKTPATPRRRAAMPAAATSKSGKKVETSSGEPAAQPADDRNAISENEAAALYRLMTWLSPSFPVGAFSYSSGIEWAVEAGDIVDAASLRDWLGAMLADGPGFCDGVFLAHAHRAASSRDDAALRDIAELAAAFVPSRERQLETSAQGRAFIDIARAAWNCDGLDRLISDCNGTIVYPVAVGLVSAAHAIALAPTLHGFFHALTSNWISAGARLIPLGQTDSQRDISRRPCEHAARDAVHPAVQVMMMPLAVSLVVPAEGGTHTPCHRVLAQCKRPFFNSPVDGYGSLLSQGRHWRTSRV